MAIYQFPGTDYHDLNLDWLLTQMKNLLAKMGDLQTDYTSYKTQIDARVDELEQQITDYLASFDARLPIEVQSLFNAYKTSDEFANYLIQTLTADSGDGSALGDIVSTWLAAHITQETGYVLDNTLTIQGAAADAKATGDAVSDLKNHFDTLETETDDLLDAMPAELFSTGDITSSVTYENISINSSGEESASSTRVASDFIPLGKGVIVHNSNASSSDGLQYWIRVYNSSKTYIANAVFSTTNSVLVGEGSAYGLTAVEDANLDAIIPVNANAAFVRLSVRYMATSSTPISPSDVWLTYTGNVLNGTNLSDVFVSGTVKPDDTSFFNYSSNLFDGTLVTGRLSNGVVDDTQTTYQTTDYIDIHGHAGEYMLVETTSGAINYWGYAYYRQDKIYLSGGNSSGTNACLIPENAYYFRATIVAGNNAASFVGISTEADAIPYEPYYQLVKPENLPASAQNWYKGKTIAALGDSITANGNDLGVSSSHSAWRQFVYKILLLSAVVVNNGIGGTRVSGSGENAMWQDARINAISIDSDVVLFNGGMNDWGGNAAIGTADSTDTDTFMGALNVVAQKLLARFPAKRIIWMTTTYGRNNNNNGDLNTLGLTTRDYAKAIRTIAQKYGFPVIDLAAECGWNEINYATYLNEENGVYIHPNRAGGKRIAEVIIGRLLQFQPVTLT